MGSGKENLSDEELIVLYKKDGDLRILARLYDPYMSLVYGVCLKYLKDREESKDAVMQVFEKLVTTLRTHDVSHFKSWLYVISRNHCLMHLRASKNRKFEDISSELMETDSESHLHSDAEQELNLGKLEKCMEELGKEQKECVRLFYLQQKCYKEIRELTGFDDNKVKSYIQNGKRNLKICMERNG
jgi:RNA polymerase sigma factor (sigma-70 family)